MKEQNNQGEIDRSLKLIIKSSFFIFFMVILSKILTYVYRIVIARQFGPEIYGLFSLSIIIFLWFVTFASLGLFDGILRFVALYRGTKDVERIKHVTKFSLGFLLILGILAGAILFLSSEFISVKFFHNSDLIIFLKILSVIMPLYMFSYAFLTIIQAFEKIRAYSLISDLLKNLANLTALAFLIFLGVKTNVVIMSYVIGIFAMFLASFLYCKYKLSLIFGKAKIRKKEKSKINYDLISYSWPLLFSWVLYQVLSDIDSFVIGYFKGATEIGLYNAVVPIVLLMGLFPNLFIRLFLPLIIKEYSRKNLSLVKELSKQVEKWILTINLPIFLLMIIFPEAIINVLFGSEYILAKNALRFLAIGTFIYFLSLVFRNLLYMVGKSKPILKIIIIAASINLVLNLFIVPLPSIFGLDNSLGITGAAIATTISYIILTLLFFFQVRKNLPITPLKREMLRVLVSVLISGAFLMVTKKIFPYNTLSLFSQVLFFLLLYIVLLFATKSLDKNDLMIFKTIKQKLHKQS